MKTALLFWSIGCICLAAAIWLSRPTEEESPAVMQALPCPTLPGQYGLAVYNHDGVLIEHATRSTGSSQQLAEEDTRLEFRTFEDAVRHAVKLQEYLGPQVYVHVTQEL